MKRLAVGLIIGLGLGLSLSSMAGRSQRPRPISCGWPKRSHLTYRCVVPRLAPNAPFFYKLDFPQFDLSCLASAEQRRTPTSPAGLGCDRLSVRRPKCNDGVIGSTGVFMTARRFEIDEPRRCVMTRKPPYYRVTRGYVRHVYPRNP